MKILPLYNTQLRHDTGARKKGNSVFKPAYYYYSRQCPVFSGEINTQKRTTIDQWNDWCSVPWP